MARALADIFKELNSVYQPQHDVYNRQLGTVDPQLQAEEQGLEAQKRDSFQQITDQANRRGMFYSGLPIAEEQRYTGQQFLPAIANLRAKYSSQRFGLQDAIAKLTAEQANRAQDIFGQETELDLQRQLADEAAARSAASAKAGASGFSPSFGGGTTGNGEATAKPAGGVDWNGLVQQNNPYVFKDLLTNANQTYFGGKATYGQLAGWLEGQIGKIPSGTAADLALRNIYMNAELDPTRKTISTVNQAIGR